ncbi:MAG: hypothetical protein MK102_04830 [Fuerstiella sp.]|nr:hypothetical protein [Fuerstiella sp.]
MNYATSRLLLLVSVTWLVTTQFAQCDDQELLDVISRAGPQGAGSFAARAARDELAQRNVEFLPLLLAAMNTSNPIAANWYRTIYQEIVTRGLSTGETHWPIAFLKQYVGDTKRNGKPRRLVLSLIDRLEPDFRNRWLPSRLTDPEFRSEAVALAINAGDQALTDKNTEMAKAQFQKAFQYARDRSLVTQSAERLRSIGETADVIRHLGLVTDWWLTGPFDAPEKTGFALTFEPENGVNLNAEYLGQNNATFGWSRYRTTDALGQLNLVDALTKADEAVAYAWTEITVEHGQKAQLRCSADDCCLVWLNEKIVSPHEQWLNGTRFDRFADTVTLVAGRNTILVKVCQGPQHRNPEVFNNWSVQVRLCDDEGRGISFRNALPAIPTK